MSKEQIKKNHHKQPQFYLKGFATKCDCPTTPRKFAKPDRSIWVYEKGKPFSENNAKRENNNPRCQGIENTAFTEYFYAFEEENGTRNSNKYEDLLEQQFEKPANPVIEKIRRFEEIKENEKIHLSRYVASMSTRGEWYRNKQKESIEKGVAEIKLKLEGQEDIIDERANLKFSGEFFPKDIINQASKLSEDLETMNFQYLIPTNSLKFFTSDCPVFRANNGNEDGFIFMPVSSDIIVCISNNKNVQNPSWIQKSKSFFEIDCKKVVAIRKNIASTAIKEVYYSQKAEWLVKFINNRIDK
jgi:Protein of unknown function (DUF4238)